MISLDPKRYLGKCSLVIRTWDGIDQPDYYPVFDLTEEELTLDSGRFSRYIKQTPKENYTLFLRIFDPKDELFKIIPWIVENTIGGWSVDIRHHSLFDIWQFIFTNSNDAVLFRLTWDAKLSWLDLYDG